MRRRRAFVDITDIPMSILPKILPRIKSPIVLAIASANQNKSSNCHMLWYKHAMAYACTTIHHIPDPTGCLRSLHTVN
ncbi:hypothetical protein E2C01_030167 [Portunus trituberculatus]|uniref:Uncharacterized protein n=1 Tax=Portunus trituberculatus TaxID=210409 RepID=A0A5B7EPR2_PORTR|nr:hypothetical protein [Portunus trituberculatus]